MNRRDGCLLLAQEQGAEGGIKALKGVCMCVKERERKYRQRERKTVSEARELGLILSVKHWAKPFNTIIYFIILELFMLYLSPVDVSIKEGGKNSCLIHLLHPVFCMVMAHSCFGKFFKAN